MLSAADEAASSLGGALAATRVAIGGVEGLMLEESSGEEAQRRVDAARAAVEEGIELTGRIELLFDLESGLGESLTEARRALRRAIANIGPTPPELERAVQAVNQADDHYKRFVAGARRTAADYRGPKIVRYLPPLRSKT